MIMKVKAKVLIPIILIIVIVAVAVRIVSFRSDSTGRQKMPTLVKITFPERQKVVQRIQLTGDISPIRQANVFARVSGNLESIKADIGDYVKSGQLLARIDTTELAQTYRQTEATYQNAKTVYDRAKTLRDQNLISKQEFDNDETGMIIAKENYETARTRLDYAQITAPFTGYVTRRYLDPGALVGSGNSTLFKLMDIDVMKILVNVLEKDVPLVKVGTKAIIEVDAYPGKEFTGSVTRLSQALDMSTRTMPVEIDIANKDHILKPGMFASVSLIIKERENILTIPVQAMLSDTSGNFVYLAGQGKAHRQNIQAGVEQDSFIEVVSGLTDTDSLITTGQQYAKDGGPIIVRE
jgi:RND family efflux transporter MFP subunit